MQLLVWRWLMRQRKLCGGTPIPSKLCGRTPIPTSVWIPLQFVLVEMVRGWVSTQPLNNVKYEARARGMLTCLIYLVRGLGLWPAVEMRALSIWRINSFRKYPSKAKAQIRKVRILAMFLGSRDSTTVELHQFTGRQIKASERSQVSILPCTNKSKHIRVQPLLFSINGLRELPTYLCRTRRVMEGRWAAWTTNDQM